MTSREETGEDVQAQQHASLMAVWSEATKSGLFQVARVTAEALADGYNENKRWWRRRRGPLSFWPVACDIARRITVEVSGRTGPSDV